MGSLGGRGRSASPSRGPHDTARQHDLEALLEQVGQLQAVIRAAFDFLVLREREDESAAESPKTAAMYRV